MQIPQSPAIRMAIKSGILGAILTICCYVMGRVLSYSPLKSFLLYILDVFVFWPTNALVICAHHPYGRLFPSLTIIHL